ncbi:MAG: S49 family peptidase [Gammaproteobacteria bacterium]|nr:S49 family peptidase [Gammaproteobacteria bacterium]MDE0302456.1 S49 family peptidase [Gammaproteobacteria bacterium]
MPNWSEVLNEINQLKVELNAQSPSDIVRRKYLKKLFEKTGRNVIAYYSGWLSKPNLEGIQITDEDKNAIMMAVHELDRSVGLDLVLHTPGGELPATESIIDYLHRMFGDDIRVIVPQIAMSAGTLIACASKEILMGTHSNLGPIDPQVRGVPAYGVIEEFRSAAEEIKEDPHKIHVWGPILSKYHPTFLSQCQNAIKHGREVALYHLENNMLKGITNVRTRRGRARRIVKGLTDYSGNGSHAKHIHIDECKKLGLRVKDLEKDPELQDIVLTVHHAFMNTCMNTPSFKIIENHLGRALVKLQVAQPVQG